MPALLYQFIKRIGCPLGMRLGTFVQHKPLHFNPVTEGSQISSFSGSTRVVGLVTPSLNQGRFIEGAMDSVLSQDIPNLRYAVMDGGSDDETIEHIKSRADRLSYWCSEPDNGQSHAINNGFAHVLEGNSESDQSPMGPMDVMGWINADDRLIPGALQCVLQFFEKNPEVDLVYGHRIVLDVEGSEVGRWVLPKHKHRSTWWGHYAPQETMFWRRRLWDAMIADGSDDRGIDESLHFAMDWDLFIRLEETSCRLGRRIERIDAFLGAFTTHASQKSVAHKERYGRKEFARIRDRHCGSGWSRIAYR